ncbi:TolC family protein [Cupriavidus metallidurans]|uniref:TolC family protein n=1 Tax=Cupriavidus metallidurans TaxID=119219 RepID=UPI0035C71CA7
MFASILRRSSVATILLALGTTALSADESVTEGPRANPALQRFIQDLATLNPDVLAAGAALDASGALRDAAARPLYNPELSAEAERSSDDARTVGISQTLDWAGKRQARSQAAEHERLLAESRYQLALWSFSTDLLTRLAAHQTARERDQLAAAAERAMTEFAALAERRFAAGDLNQVDLSLARLAATDAHIQRATRTGDLAAATQAVRALAVDAPPASWPQLRTPPALTQTGETAQTLVRGLPEVRVAQRQIELADARVTVQRKAQRPDPTLTLRAGEQADESLVGLSLSIPLFVRNRYDNEVRAALAVRNEAQFSADAVLRRAYARLESARERYQLLRGAWDVWERSGQPSLTLQTEQLRQLWEAGEMSAADYLVQLRQTIEVQDNAFALRLALWEGWLEWLRASGRIDDWLSLDTMATRR